jgi:hypothetical protein
MIYLPDPPLPISPHRRWPADAAGTALHPPLSVESAPRCLCRSPSSRSLKCQRHCPTPASPTSRCQVLRRKPCAETNRVQTASPNTTNVDQHQRRLPGARPFRPPKPWLAFSQRRYISKRSMTQPHDALQRARIVLLSTQGLAGPEIADRVGCTKLNRPAESGDADPWKRMESSRDGVGVSRGVAGAGGAAGRRVAAASRLGVGGDHVGRGQVVIEVNGSAP